MFEVNPGLGVFLIDSSSVVPIPCTFNVVARPFASALTRPALPLEAACPATPDTGLAPALGFDAPPPADLHRKRFSLSSASDPLK